MKAKDAYHAGSDFQFEHEEIALGAPSSYSLTHDPKHLAFVLARYKFCAKMRLRSSTLCYWSLALRSF